MSLRIDSLFVFLSCFQSRKTVFFVFLFKSVWSKKKFLNLWNSFKIYNTVLQLMRIFSQSSIGSSQKIRLKYLKRNSDKALPNSVVDKQCLRSAFSVVSCFFINALWSSRRLKKSILITLVAALTFDFLLRFGYNFLHFCLFYLLRRHFLRLDDQSS